MTTDKDLQLCREAFERWAIKKRWPLIIHEDTGEYADNLTLYGWYAWQARTPDISALVEVLVKAKDEISSLWFQIREMRGVPQNLQQGEEFKDDNGVVWKAYDSEITTDYIAQALSTLKTHNSGEAV